VLLVPASTALYRFAPPAYLAAYTFFFKQGETLDAEQFRAQLTLAGYTHVTRSWRRASTRSAAAWSTSSRWARRCPTASTSSTTRSRASRPSTSTPAHALSGAEVRLLPAREFPLDDKGRTRFRQRFREVFEGDPAKSGIYKDISPASPSAGIEYWLPLFFEETATLFDYLPKDARALPAQRRARGDPRLLARHADALRHALRRKAPAAAAGRTVPPRNRSSSPPSPTRASR
jgi:transcription-repair coupling factor (superfamily II helicase)